MLVFERLLFICMSLTFIGVHQAASAVELSPDGQGQVVILPVFAATSEVTTVITVHNTDRLVSKAVRIRVRSDAGTALRSFNLYLGRYDTWTAAIINSGDQVLVQSADQSCALEFDGDELIPFRPVHDIEATHGFIEIIELGSMGDPDDPLEVQIEGRQCDALMQRWIAGSWSTDPLTGLNAPTGTIRATASIINVSKGTLYSIPITALRGFSDIAQHTLPNNSLPNLGSAHDSQTGDGLTRALVCTSVGCEEDHFATPLGAVNAVLMAHELTTDYSNQASIAAIGELILTFPTEHLQPSPSEQRLDIVTVGRDRLLSNYGICIDMGQEVISDFCQTPGLVSFPYHTNRNLEVITFPSDQPNSGTNSPITGLESRIELPNHPSIGDSGLMRVGFDTFRQGTLTSASGKRLFGRPAIGVMFQEFTNGNLESADGIIQRANYGGAFGASRTTKIEVP